MTENITYGFVREHSLCGCLSEFSGANGKDDTSLSKPFEALATKMICGGYIKVRDEYAIFIHTVEFYYHEEIPQGGKQIKDEIVYHRNQRFDNRNVPYFPIMSLHSHWSGFDITFENPEKQYRASALIRKYVVYDFNRHSFIKLDTTSNKEKMKKDKYYVGEIKDELFVDDRSSFLQYYLNGFPINGEESKIIWKDISCDSYLQVISTSRKNAKDHDWAFRCKDNDEYLSYIKQLAKSIDSKYSQK